MTAKKTFRQRFRAGEMADRLAAIDAAIERSGLLGRFCYPAKKRGRCACGHHDGAHIVRNRGDLPKDWTRGRCHGQFGRCPCRAFVPYDYAKETEARTAKLRAFAFDVLARVKRP